MPLPEASFGWCALLLAQPKILLVEDDADLAGALIRLLEKGGARVRHETNGHGALVALNTCFDPDLVITDLGLPHVSGSMLLGEMRKAGFEKPAIVISGSGGLDDFSEAFRNQVDAYLTKPFELKDFVAAVQTGLSREYRRLLRQAEYSELWERAREGITLSELRNRARGRLNRVRAA